MRDINLEKRDGNKSLLEREETRWGFDPQMVSYLSSYTVRFNPWYHEGLIVPDS